MKKFPQNGKEDAIADWNREKKMSTAEFSSRWDSILPESVWQALLQYMGLSDPEVAMYLSGTFYDLLKDKVGEMGVKWVKVSCEVCE